MGPTQADWLSIARVSQALQAELGTFSIYYLAAQGCGSLALALRSKNKAKVEPTVLASGSNQIGGE